MDRVLAGLRKNQIIRAAIDLWAQRGYNGTGIEELSEATGLKRGALYYHIGSKESLLHDILESSLMRLLDASRSVSAETTFELKLRSLSRVLMRDIVSNHAEWAIYHRDLPALTGDRLEKVNSLHSEYEAIWDRVLDAGSQAGVFAVMKPEGSKGILGMHFHAYTWSGARAGIDADAVSDQFVDIILYGISTRDRAGQPG